MPYPKTHLKYTFQVQYNACDSVCGRRSLTVLELILLSFCHNLTFLFLLTISISLKVDNVCEWVVEERGRSFGSGNTEMEDYNSKRGVYLLAFLVMLILNAYCCHASAVQVKGNTTFPCNDGLGECLIIEDEWNPYERRMLYPLKPQSKNRHKPAIPCGGRLDS